MYNEEREKKYCTFFFFFFKCGIVNILPTYLFNFRVLLGWYNIFESLLTPPLKIYLFVNAGFVMEGGALCLELLTPRGWSSAYSVESVIMQFTASVVKGHVSFFFFFSQFNSTLTYWLCHLLFTVVTLVEW